MDGRIVISFRCAGGTGRGFAERARALSTQAAAAGGSLVAWDATKITFALDDPTLEKSLALAIAAAGDTSGEEAAWSIGIAQGALEPLAADAGSLAWGPPLVAASLLASAAQPGEILCAQSVRAVRSGELLTHGTRVGRDGPLRVRGVRIDRGRPWRKDAVAQLVRVRAPRLVGRATVDVAAAPGALTLVRADAGTGGTRLLAELAARTPRALVVSPSGSGWEPLGALRRALDRAVSLGVSPHAVDVAEPLERLLSGAGVPVDAAAKLVAAFVGPFGAVLVDDATAVDPGSREACARAARSADSIGVVARVHTTEPLPPSFAGLPRAPETAIGPLGHGEARELLLACTSGPLDDVAVRRWTRLGGGMPLATLEALAWGIASGELVFDGDRGAPRARASGRGKARSAAHWIKLRAADESDAARTVLGVVALLGGDAKIARIGRVLEAAGVRVAVGETIEELARARWLDATQPGWVALPSRTHAVALYGLVDEATKTALHRAAAEVVGAEETGTLGRIESAFHAARAGDVTGASRTFVAVSRAAAEAGLELSAQQLLDEARRLDPSCEAPAVAAPPPQRPAVSQPPSLPPSTRSRRFTDLPVPDLRPADSLSPATSPAAASIASRLGELAKEALVAGDSAALGGESAVFAERMRAMARIARGDIGDALRVLRRTRSQLDAKDHALRCQTSLAMGVALSVAGRHQEALLEGMDALARARQIEDKRAVNACLAFLAKLYTSVGRPEDAEKLRATAASLG